MVVPPSHVTNVLNFMCGPTTSFSVMHFDVTRRWSGSGAVLPVLALVRPSSSSFARSLETIGTGRNVAKGLTVLRLIYGRTDVMVGYTTMFFTPTIAREGCYITAGIDNDSLTLWNGFPTPQIHIMSTVPYVKWRCCSGSTRPPLRSGRGQQ